MTEDNSEKSFDKVKKGLKETAEGIKEGVEDTAEGIKEGVEDSARESTDAYTKLYEQDPKITDGQTSTDSAEAKEKDRKKRMTER
jgi:hypothetical protein